MIGKMFKLLERFVGAVESLAASAEEAGHQLGCCADAIAAVADAMTVEVDDGSGGGEPEISPAMLETLSDTRLA